MPKKQSILSSDDDFSSSSTLTKDIPLDDEDTCNDADSRLSSGSLGEKTQLI